MAFGIKRGELQEWKEKVRNGEIAFLTHYWIHPRFDGITTVTKAGCCDVKKLIDWGSQYGLKEEWIHKRDQYPHFDLIGDTQLEILKKEGQWTQIHRFFEHK
ncbi:MULTISPECIES: hypothetical protein [Bacillaceae]|uniref:YneQ n=1 Tax=Sutcliffiella horikoshii TaxID=79883 RepID=A0A5D4TCH5_9BACI|nr:MULTISPECIES: hypothetical protein [Bacillaceae]TYS72985.1 hypothetical protein FZC75_07930 [Sutcliffiella horikoshii]